MLRFWTYDVFTNEPFSGNPLAVVEGADDLSDAQMQTIAREFNLSETIFLRAPANPAHDASVRIFTPVKELPFAGHPTIGCAIHLASARNGAGGKDVKIVLEEVAGLVPVVVRGTGATVEAEFVAPVIPAPTGVELGTDIAAAALGLDIGEIGFAGHVPGVHAGGPAFTYVPVRSLDALGRARPISPAWETLTALAEATGVFAYTAEGGGFRARMFAPQSGIPEDPATGSACAIFASQLLTAGDLPDGETRLSLAQGVEMGRPSLIGLSISVRTGAIANVRVSGSAVRISEGTISIP